VSVAEPRMFVSSKVGIAYLTVVSQPRSELVEAALKTRSSPANGGDRVLSLIVTLHVGATMGLQLTVQQPHLFQFLTRLVTGVLIVRRGPLPPLNPKVLQDARTHRPLPRKAQRTKRRRGLLAANLSRVKMKERGVNLARSEGVVIWALRLARPTRLQITTGGAGHERDPRRAIAHRVCR
jgi:hypothetical protein